MERRRNRGLNVVLAIAAVGLLAVLVWRGKPRGAVDHDAKVAVDREGNAHFVDDRAVDETTRPGVITGTVSDSEGRGVDGAAVIFARVRLPDQQFLPDFGRALQLVRTTAGGRFRFENVKVGVYAVSAMADGLLPSTQGPVAVKGGEEVQVQIRLGPGGVVLSGHIYDVGGGPVPNAKVSARENSRPRVSGTTFVPVVYQISADENGAYRMSLAKEEYWVTVEAPGYAPASDRVLLGGPQTKDFRLVPGARISGRVVERDSKRPVPDAQMWVFLSRAGRSGAPQDVRSDDAGMFTLEGLEPEIYRVAARKGRLVGTSLPLSLGLAQSVNDVEVEVDPAFVMAGRVSDSKGTPVVGARMQVFKDQPPYEQPFIGVSDKDGRFRFEGLLPGPYRLEGAAEGTASARQIVRMVRDELDLRLTLPVGASVKGQVMSELGAPVPGVTVDLRLNARSMGTIGLGDRKATDAEGRFSFRGLAAGMVTVAASDKERGFASADEESLAEGETKVVTLTLKGVGSISGTVRASDGRPAAGVRVEGSRMGARGLSNLTDVTAADGTYRLSPVPPGNLLVLAVSGAVVEWGGPDRGDQKHVAVGEREHKTGIDLTIAGGLKIAGLVVGADGAPISGAEVSAGIERPDGMGSVMPTKTFSGVDGAFTIEDVGDGKHFVRARQTGFAEAQVTGVSGGATGTRIQLTPEATIAGVVLSSDNKPVVDYTISLNPAPKPGEVPGPNRNFGIIGDRPLDTVHDPAGRFWLSGLRAGAYTLQVRTPQGNSGSSSVTIAAGEKKTGVRVEVEASGKVIGRVIDEDGITPLPNVDITGFSTGVLHARSVARTNAAGTFALEGVPAGEQLHLQVMGDPKTHVPERRRVDVTKGGTTDLGSIRLVRGDVPARMKAGTWNGHAGFGIADDGTGAIGGVRPESPAGQAGLKNGDVVVSVDGKPIKGLSTGATDYHLRGRPGSPVTLVVQSPGAAPRTVTFNRYDITGPDRGRPAPVPAAPPGGRPAAPAQTPTRAAP